MRFIDPHIHMSARRRTTTSEWRRQASGPLSTGISGADRRTLKWGRYAYLSSLVGGSAWASHFGIFPTHDRTQQQGIDRRCPSG